MPKLDSLNRNNIAIKNKTKTALPNATKPSSKPKKSAKGAKVFPVVRPIPTKDMLAPSPETSFPCDWCQVRPFETLEQLNAHLRLKCRADKQRKRQIWCPYCMKRFLLKFEVNQHLKTCAAKLNMRST